MTYGMICLKFGSSSASAADHEPGHLRARAVPRDTAPPRPRTPGTSRIGPAPRPARPAPSRPSCRSSSPPSQRLGPVSSDATPRIRTLYRPTGPLPLRVGLQGAQTSRCVESATTHRLVHPRCVVADSTHPTGDRLIPDRVDRSLFVGSAVRTDPHGLQADRSAQRTLERPSFQTIPYHGVPEISRGM